jgi:phosphoribosylaminoimidazole carboxylase (NCAIR synthetase)
LKHDFLTSNSLPLNLPITFLHTAPTVEYISLYPSKRVIKSKSVSQLSSVVDNRQLLKANSSNFAENLKEKLQKTGTLEMEHQESRLSVVQVNKIKPRFLSPITS